MCLRVYSRPARGLRQHDRGPNAGGATDLLSWARVTVGVAQRLERWVVIPEAAGSNPVARPKNDGPGHRLVSRTIAV